MTRYLLSALAVSVCAAGLTVACGGSAPTEPAATSAPAANPVDPATAATVSGRVTYAGTPPAPPVIRLDGDPTCVELQAGEERHAEDLLVGADGGLINAFVYIKDGLDGYSFPAPTDPVVLDQQKCRYTPRVIGVRVGQPLEVRNSDPLLHNIRSDSEINQPFNMGQPVAGLSFTRVFTTREVMVPIKCDVHAWMRAWIGVLEHPYFAVTGEDGRFTLPELPPGTYTLEVWHETLGAQTRQITVGPKDSQDVTVTYQP
ncbi:MAG: carboxypeptidase regulatory-like domain-containing protein [Vicinamibacterales bacterium]